ncbi:hypothetical protein OHA61_38755 [Streptomyces sp. NBC_00885]|uniref:hypothetical protein n=1 Tax=Streptomyces sp. NBC_00885 TaxID=2975857 RepID=UPI0038640F6B|nr:hypothetical protein OHA61_38755 [Streptomyces sp. NBC_00885]
MFSNPPIVAAIGLLVTTGLVRLATSTEELEVLGATWDVARVRAVLRAHPGAERRPPGRPRYGERLSPREQEVAARDFTTPSPQH